ncbi:hypothetical protein [Cyclobacterium qasimii]|uniref:Transglycosylase SLT domain-containing protein n=1 Tax=Cyclobacterium qasimii M12-11B TaxID=641524 RepID=S7VCL3_9BACT|nr:hypothetical protein [Cyclobacterium qasimii]EPR67297.1 hypothetical protein ADICYQ_3688 [Cyclobacterium qasimii M12-11B]
MRQLITIITLSLFVAAFFDFNSRDNENIKELTISISAPANLHPVIDTIVFSKVEKTTGSYPWKYEWNKFISSEIIRHKEVFIDNDSIYKQDLVRLCPSYYNASENEKVALWTLLIASMAKFESNFNPNTRYQEPAPLNVFSEGLLQLSYGDETRYEDVPLDPGKQNILIPEANLKTGVAIFAKQLEIRKSIFTNQHFIGPY